MLLKTRAEIMLTFQKIAVGVVSPRRVQLSKFIGLFVVLLFYYNGHGQSTISINNPASINEGNAGLAQITFTVSIDVSDVADITVDYTITGGNQNGNSGTLTFLASTVDLDQDIIVETNGDLIVETDEAITVTLDNPSVNAVLSNGLANLDGTSSFLNDDTVTVSFSQSNGSDAESIGGNLPILLITGTVTNATTATVTDAGTGSATGGGTDYTFTSPQVVNIPAGTYDGTTGTGITIPTLAIDDDSNLESNETINLTISAVSGDASLGATTSTTYTINNDDGAITVDFSQANGSDTETSGGNLPILLITGTVVNATTVTVTDSGTGSATGGGTDYSFTSPQVINIPVGSYDGTTVTGIPIPSLSIVGDTEVEASETIDLSLTASTGDATLGTQTNTTYTITDDDSVTVSFSQSNGSDAESIGGNLPILLITGTVTNATTATVTDAGTGSATGGGTDYTFTSPQVVNIPAGTYDGTTGTGITIPTLAIDDDMDVEASETIDLTISAVSGDASLGATTSTTYTINNDDGAITVDFSQANGSDTETSGGNLPILLITGTVVNATTVTVSDSGTGSATGGGTDYSFTSPQVINIPVGSYDGTTVTGIPIPSLSIVGDTEVEASETIDLSLTASTGDATLGTQTNTTYTITDDDSVTVSFSQSNGSDAESIGGNLPILLITGTVTNATTATVTDAGTGSATGGGTDYTFTSPQVVNIPAGTYDGTTGTGITIPTLAIDDDSNLESNETINLTISAVSGDASLGATTSTTYTINNDDGAITVDFSQANGSDTETSGGNLPILLITGTVVNATTVTVTDSGTGSATGGGTDYSFTSPQVINIPVGSYDGTSVTGIAIPSLSIVGDTEVEASETIDLSLTASTGDATLGTQTNTTYTITDDDSVTVSFSQSNGSDAESIGGNLPILLITGTVTNATTATVTDAGTGSATDGVDFSFTSPQVVIIPAGTYDGTTGTGITIPTLAIDDDMDVEASETIDLTISAVSGDASLGATTSTTYTITDDESLTISIADASIQEAGILQFQVTLSAASTLDVDIEYTTNDGTAVFINGDYVDNDDTLTILAGNTVGVIEVQTVEDLLIESPDETIFVNLLSTTLGTFTDDQGEGTIIDDDDCSAGTTAPVLEATESTVFCDVISKDLNDYVSSTTPANAELRWSLVNTGLDDDTNHLPSSLITEVGTYYGFYFDDVNDCESPVLEVTITLNTTPSSGIPENTTACNVLANGPTTVDLDNQLTGTIDSGLWSYTDGPEGSVILNPDPSNVVNFNNAPPGTYVYTYTTDNAIAPCLNATSSVSIVVNDCTIPCNAGVNPPALNEDITTNFCDSIDVNLDSYALGTAPDGAPLTWSLNSDPLETSAHLSNTQINAPGTYYGFYYDEVNLCASEPLPVQISVASTPSILSTTGASSCGAGFLTLTAEASPGSTLKWYGTLTGGTPIGDEGESFTTPVSISETTTYFVEAESNGCSSERIAVVAEIIEGFSAGSTTNQDACNISNGLDPNIIDLDATLTGADTGGIWTITSGPDAGEITINAENEVDFLGLAAGGYVFTYTIAAADPCPDASVDVVINVTTCPPDTDGDGLTDEEEQDLGTDETLADSDGDLINDGQEVLEDNTDPLNDCESIGGTPLGTSDCDNDGLTNDEEATLLTDPFDADSDNDGLSDGVEVNGNPTSDPLDACDPNLIPECLANAIDLSITKTSRNDKLTGLVGEQVTFIITVTNETEERIAEVTISEPIGNGFLYISHTATRGIYDFSRGVWQIDNWQANEANTLELTVRLTDTGSFTNTASITNSLPVDSNSSNNEASVSILTSEPPMNECGFVYNEFSPNGDDTNDVLWIECIEQFPNNTLEIFDRYGNSVYEIQGYDNTWRGSGKNGDLPRGTYFYFLDLGDGSEVKRGWIQILR